jgi:hypothetical protein
MEKVHRFFYNASAFAEMPIFNSSLINIRFGRNFGSDAFDRIDADLEVNGSPVRFESTGKMNGWVFEVGYKIPLNAVFKKQSNLKKKL